MSNADPRIGVDYRQDVTIISLTRKRILDSSDIEAIENSIIPVVEQARPINLVLDFSEVEFLSSAMLGVLIRISRRVYESNGKLAFCCINSKIFQIFKITRLNKIFDIYDNQDQAVSALTDQQQ